MICMMILFHRRPWFLSQMAKKGTLRNVLTRRDEIHFKPCGSIVTSGAAATL